MTKWRLLVPVAFIGTVYGANWALKTFGVLDVFGVAVPAGVLFAGVAFTLRDITHRFYGRWVCLAAILIGSALAYVLEDVAKFAIASAVAFSASEVMDLVVYERLRRVSWLSAVVASNTVGAIADSAIFLFLAFGSLSFIAGQILGKVAMTLPVLLWRPR